MVQMNQNRADSFRIFRGTPSVLCVDDEPLTRKALRRLLRNEPYTLHFAETPRQALDLLRARPVDLVITDQRMPEMSGVELLRRIQKTAPGTSGLILTAYPESVFVDDPPEVPRPPLFSKPWDDETLLGGIQELLEQRGGGTGRLMKFPEWATGTDAPALPEIRRSGAAARPADFRQVLVPLDGSIEAELSLGSVLPLLEGGPSRLTLLRVTDLGLHPDVYDYLQRSRERLASQGIDAIADVRRGDPAEQILLHARHSHADLIVLPLHRKRRFARLFGRSVTEKVLRRSEIPVLVSRPDLALRTFQRIAVFLDGSKAAESVLPEAVRLAAKTGASIDVLGSISGADARIVASGSPSWNPMRYLSEVADLLGLADVEAAPLLLIGDPAEELVRALGVRGADLVCMTDACRSGWRRLLEESVAERVIEGAPCPVYVRKIPRGPGPA